MALPQAPSSPRQEFEFVSRDTFGLTQYGLTFLEDLWRQIAAGFVIVPCGASMASNVITLTPLLHDEGARSYATGMTFQFKAPATSSGTVTALLSGSDRDLTTVKVYASPGTTQANSGDIVSGGIYLLIYDETLDSGNGGFVLK